MNVEIIIFLIAWLFTHMISHGWASECLNEETFEKGESEEFKSLQYSNLVISLVLDLENPEIVYEALRLLTSIQIYGMLFAILS